VTVLGAGPAKGISKSQVSEMSKILDAQVTAFRDRVLDAGPYSFVWMDALTQKVREGGPPSVLTRSTAPPATIRCGFLRSIVIADTAPSLTLVMCAPPSSDR
jgi:hypothetical protein